MLVCIPTPLHQYRTRRSRAGIMDAQRVLPCFTLACLPRRFVDSRSGSPRCCCRFGRRGNVGWREEEFESDESPVDTVPPG